MSHFGYSDAVMVYNLAFLSMFFLLGGPVKLHCKAPQCCKKFNLRVALAKHCRRRHPDLPQLIPKVCSTAATRFQQLFQTVRRTSLVDGISPNSECSEWFAFIMISSHAVLGRFTSYLLYQKCRWVFFFLELNKMMQVNIFLQEVEHFFQFLICVECVQFYCY